MSSFPNAGVWPATARLLAPARLSRTQIYVGCLMVGAAAMASGFIVAGLGLGDPVAVTGISAVALLAERSGIRLTKSIEASTASLPFIFAAALFGPLSAMLIGVVALVPDAFRRDDPEPVLRWLNWTSVRAISAGAAGSAAWAVLGGDSRPAFGIVLAAVSVACLIDAFADLAFGALVMVIRGSGSTKDMTGTLGPLLLLSAPLYAPILAILAYAYRALSPWSAAMFVIPAFAAQRLFLLYRQQRSSTEELAAVNRRLEQANLSFATALVATLDARDRYTAGHSAAVAIYARDIAQRMGLSEAEQQQAHLCGLVHDVGKVGLSPGLLEKPGALTLEERRQMAQHCEIGERILAKVDDYAEIAAIVRHHHERVDGNGYPDALAADDIPLLARIIAVADAYNAMTSDRPYRDAMPSRVARLRLAQAVETQFDTSVVAAFEAILASAPESYRTGSRSDFNLEIQGEPIDHHPQRQKSSAA